MSWLKAKPSGQIIDILFRIYYFFCFILVSGWWRLNFFHNGNLFWLSVYSCVQLIVNGMFPYKQSCLYANILLVTVAWNVFFYLFRFFNRMSQWSPGCQSAPFPCLYLVLGAPFLSLLWDPISPTDTNDEDSESFLPLAPTVGHVSSYWHKR